MKGFLKTLIVLFFLSTKTLFAQAPASDSSTNKSPTIGVYKGKLPESKKYWEYNNWYKNNSVLSVVVSAENKEELLEVFDELKGLRKKNVLIGKIVLIGAKYLYLINADYDEIMKNMKQNAAQFQKGAASNKELVEQLTEIKYFSDIKQEMNLPDAANYNPEALFKKFDITYSPTWIVRYQGKEFVYEGRSNIKRLFTNDGQFIGANE